MKKELGFEIVKLFKILLVIVFYLEIKKGFFRGFWETLKNVLNENKWFISFYFFMVILIMFKVDKQVFNYWQTSAFQNWTYFYMGVIGNLLGNGEYLFSFAILGILISKIYKREDLRKKISLALTSSVFTGIVSAVFKFIFTRKRPVVSKTPFEFENYTWNIAENFKLLKADHSFPSGHTAVAVAFFFTLGFLTKNKFLKILFFILPIITAFARVYYSKHWVSDVSTSYLLGTLVALVINRLYVKNRESI